MLSIGRRRWTARTARRPGSGGAPVCGNQTLGTALFRYDGSLLRGLDADGYALPYVHDLMQASAAEFELLRQGAAGASRK